MAIQREIIESEIRTTGGKQVQDEIIKVNQAIKSLGTEEQQLIYLKKKLEAEGKKNTEMWRNNEKAIKLNREEQKRQREELSKLNGQLKISEMTYNQLSKRAAELRGKLSNVSQALDSKKWNAYNKELNEVNAQMGRVRAGTQQTSAVMSALKGALPVVGFAALVAGAKRLLSNIIDVRSEFEKYEAVLKNSLGSLQAAQREMAMLEQFAATTPFQLGELTGAFVKLVNQGFKPSQEQMRLLGDLAASTGKGFDQLAEAIIDAQTGEFERLKEFGIRSKKEGDKIIFTFKGVETQVDYTSQSIQDYILGLGNAQGVSGAMAEISETLGGKISNLKDTWTSFINLLGSQTGGIINKVIGWLTSLIQYAGGAMRTIKQIQKQVFDKDTLEAIENGVKEVEDISNRLIESGITKSKAQERAMELYTQSINIAIDGYKDKLKTANESDQEYLNEKIKALEAERDGVKGHFDELNKIAEAASSSQEKANSEDITEEEKRNNEIFKQRSSLYDKFNQIVKQYNLQQMSELDQQLAAVEEKYNNEVAAFEKAAEEKIITAEEAAAAIEKIWEMHASEVIEITNKAMAEENEAIATELKKSEDMQLEAIDAYEKNKADLIAEYGFKSRGELKAQMLNDLEENRKTLLENDELTAEQRLEVEKQYQENRKAINAMFLRASLEEIRNYAAAHDALYKTSYEVIATLQDTQMTNIEADYDRKIKLAGDDKTLVTKLEEEKEKKLKATKKKYADATFALQIGRIVAPTAQAAINSYNSLSTIPIVGPVLGAIAAAAAVALGGVQIAKANAERNKAKSLYTGGYTGDGHKLEPAGTVHKGEYVVSSDELAAPQVRSFIGGVVEPMRMRRLGYSPYAYNTTMPGYANGGFTGSGSQIDNTFIERVNSSINRQNEFLLTILSEGVNANFDETKIFEMRQRISRQENGEYIARR